MIEDVRPSTSMQERKAYQKFSQAPPNKMKPPAVLDYRANKKDVQTNKNPPVGRYPEWQKDSQPFKKGQIVSFFVVVTTMFVFATISPTLHQK
jgi:hypothetical protein